MKQFKSREFTLTRSRHKLVRSLAEELAIRKMKMEQKELEKYGQRGFYVEGPSGVGKSELIKQFLIENGIRFYHITPTDINEMKKILHKAFHEGAVVLVDEFNSMAMEKIWNRFLSGKDLEGNRAANPGFLVLGTGNPASFRGRVTLSPAQKNRVKTAEIDEPPREELKEILVAQRYATVADSCLEIYDRKKRTADSPSLRDLLDMANEEKKASSVLPENTQLSQNSIFPFGITLPTIFSTMFPSLVVAPTS